MRYSPNESIFEANFENWEAAQEQKTKDNIRNGRISTNKSFWHPPEHLILATFKIIQPIKNIKVRKGILLFLPDVRDQFPFQLSHFKVASKYCPGQHLFDTGSIKHPTSLGNTAKKYFLYRVKDFSAQKIIV